VKSSEDFTFRHKFERAAAEDYEPLQNNDGQDISSILFMPDSAEPSPVANSNSLPRRAQTTQIKFAKHIQPRPVHGIESAQLHFFAYEYK
jgi:predicted acyl esterase